MLNEVRLIGRLGADPDIRQTSTGKDVASLRVATWEVFFNEQKKEYETISEWHSVIVWGDQVKNRVAKMQKGNLVLIEGKLKTRKYTDKNNVERYVTDIVGNARLMPKTEGKAGSQPENAAPAYPPQGAQTAAPNMPPPDSDLPF